MPTVRKQILVLISVKQMWYQREFLCRAVFRFFYWFHLMSLFLLSSWSHSKLNFVLVWLIHVTDILMCAVSSIFLTFHWFSLFMIIQRSFWLLTLTVWEPSILYSMYICSWNTETVFTLFWYLGTFGNSPHFISSCKIRQ